MKPSKRIKQKLFGVLTSVALLVNTFTGTMPEAVMTALANDPGAQTEAEAGITSWAELQTAVNAGGNVTLTQSVSAAHEAPALIIPQDVDVTLDLNGKKLSNVSDDNLDYFIEVYGTLTLTDSSDENATITPTAVTMTSFAWTDYTFTISGNGTTRITFTPAKRFLLDEVLIMAANTIPGTPLAGDVNGDGTVDVADIATVISVMANVGADPVSARNADVNGDGTIDVADIATIISIMAGEDSLNK